MLFGILGFEHWALTYSFAGHRIMPTIGILSFKHWALLFLPIVFAGH